MNLGKNLVLIKEKMEIKNLLRLLTFHSSWFLIIYMLLLSAILSVAFSPSFPGADSLIHLIVFIPYGFLFGMMSYDFLLLLGFPIYGEAIQMFFPWKFFDLIDMAINIFGAYIGFFIAVSIRRRILFSLD